MSHSAADAIEYGLCCDVCGAFVDDGQFCAIEFCRARGDLAVHPGLPDFMAIACWDCTLGFPTRIMLRGSNPYDTRTWIVRVEPECEDCWLEDD